MYRNAKEPGEMHWGRIHPISQYVLIFLAVTFTWLMGLMGYVRSGLRQHWHVYGVMRDTSVDAFTPTLGFATRIVSVTVLIFFMLIGFVFWLASLLDDHKDRTERARERPRPPLKIRRPDRGDARPSTRYVGQLVPQKEVQPPQGDRAQEGHDPDEMVKVGKEIMEGKGLCITCHTVGKSGALRFPDLAGIGARADDAPAGPLRRRLPGRSRSTTRTPSSCPASTPACR